MSFPIDENKKNKMSFEEDLVKKISFVLSYHKMVLDILIFLMKNRCQMIHLFANEFLILSYKNHVLKFHFRNSKKSANWGISDQEFVVCFFPISKTNSPENW